MFATSVLGDNPVPALFKPFVLIDLSDPESAIINGGVPTAGTETGWAADVNLQHRAVVNIHHKTNGWGPYFFDPTRIDSGFDDGEQWTELQKTADQVSYTDAVAFALNNAANWQDTIIVGYVLENSSSKLKSAWWQYDANTEKWELHIIPGMATYASEATDVNDDNKIVGRAAANNNFDPPQSFIYTISTSTLLSFAPNDDSQANAINNADPAEIVGEFNDNGTWKAYYWQEGSTQGLTEIHDPLLDEWSGALAINDDYSNITGWRWPNGIHHGAVYWENMQGNWDWTAINLPLGTISKSGRDLNNHNEVVVSYDDGTSGAFLWAGPTLLYNLDDLTLIFNADSDGDPQNDARIHEIHAINDDGWMAGSFNREGDPDSIAQPCLIIPYDTDNNGEPDYREILNNPALDANDPYGREWLLDSSELLHVGLHAPSTDIEGDPIARELVTNVQAARIPAKQNQLNSLLKNAQLCQNYADYFTAWGDYNSWTNPIPNNAGGAEIILYHRTQHNDLEDYDYRPSDDPPYQELSDREVLDNLYRASYRYSKCIDYVQIGNEISAGPGTFYFDDGQLTCGSYGSLLDIPDTCYLEGVDFIYEWLALQIKEIVYGSALAGRPLRVYTPALTIGNVNQAVSGNINGPFDPVNDVANRQARFLYTLIELANKNQAIIDQHTRYLNYADVDSILTALWDWDNNYAWASPPQVGTLETAPKPSGDWLNSGGPPTYGEQVVRYYNDGNCTEALDMTYNDFIRTMWEPNQFSVSNSSFMIVDSSPGANDGLFSLHNNHHLLHACFGSVYQDVNGGCDDLQDVFSLQSLRANRFRWVSQLGGGSDWTVFRDDFEDATDQYIIDTFTPHTEACQCPQ